MLQQQIMMLDKALNPYLSGLLNDPHFLVNLGKSPGVRLEKPSVSGGKFWMAVAVATRLQITWGKLGTQGCTKDFPQDQCAKDNHVLELRRRAHRKLREGYVIVSLYDTHP